MTEPLSPAPEENEPSKGPWLGLSIGFVIILAVIGTLIFRSRSSPTRMVVRQAVSAPAPADPYAANLAISDVVMSAAENFVGGTATYVEGKVSNNGSKTVTGASVEITFKNSLDQVVQREAQPLMVIQAREPAIDVAALNVAPLAPGQSREFRLTFEHVSADWNRNYPELRITTISTK